MPPVLPRSRRRPRKIRVFLPEGYAADADANLRTLPGKDHRAVVGLSMGGYEALRYAEARPDLFGHATALSGGIDFGMPAIRAAVTVATELNLTGAWCAVSTSTPSGTDACTGYGPYVDSDAVFGSPYPVFGADRVRNAVNPAASANLARLRGTKVTLYTGDQGLIDSVTAVATRTVKSRLDQIGLPSRLVDYGNGSSLSPTCDGGHNYGCWAPAFADYVPRLEADFAAADTTAQPAHTTTAATAWSARTHHQRRTQTRPTAPPPHHRRAAPLLRGDGGTHPLRRRTPFPLGSDPWC